MSYNALVYNEQGGSKLVVASGGQISIESGGKITAAGTQASAIVDITDNTGGTAGDTIANTGGANPTTAEFENAVASITAKLNAVLAALRGAGIIAS